MAPAPLVAFVVQYAYEDVGGGAILPVHAASSEGGGVTVNAQGGLWLSLCAGGAMVAMVAMTRLALMHGRGNGECVVRSSRRN